MQSGSYQMLLITDDRSLHRDLSLSHDHDLPNPTYSTYPSYGTLEGIGSRVQNLEVRIHALLDYFQVPFFRSFRIFVGMMLQELSVLW